MRQRIRATKPIIYLTPTAALSAAYAGNCRNQAMALTNLNCAQTRPFHDHNPSDLNLKLVVYELRGAGPAGERHDEQEK